ncbi:hypothetical protein IKN40_08700, partial [bacterium]|nr:hypothetical protein [bacterium]
MATKLWTQEIKKNTDWSGDDSTNGLPVSGQQVQKFIKDTLNTKFGYLSYDKSDTYTQDKIEVQSHQPSNQYIIFADIDEFRMWAENPALNESRVLARFNAPAPATIEISNMGEQTKTILEVDKDSVKLSFDYRVKKAGVDSSDSASYVKSPMNYTISINNNISGVTTLPVGTLNMGSGNAADYVNFQYDIGQYLKTGINTITIILTSTIYNVSTNIVYQYNVLSLSLKTDNFNYTTGYPIDSSKTALEINLIAKGLGRKFLNVYIDGIQLTDLNSLNNQNVFNQTDAYIGEDNTNNWRLILPFKNDNQYKSWAIPGLHNIQILFYIQNSQLDEKIYSKTLYYDFVLTSNTSNPESYILFANEFPEKTIITTDNIDEEFKLTINQYESIKINYGVYDTLGRGNIDDGKKIKVEIDLKDNDNNVLFETQNVAASGEVLSFEKQIDQIFSNGKLTIKNSLSGFNKNIIITVNNSNINISITKDNLLLELNAKDRSNNESSDTIDKWEYLYSDIAGGSIYTVANFEKVLWNHQNGWIDKCLVLNNGAKVNIPFNFFSLQQQTTADGQGNGITFEIDFETEDVQNDDAIIMQYGDENGAHILIKACSDDLS